MFVFANVKRGVLLTLLFFLSACSPCPSWKLETSTPRYPPVSTHQLTYEPTDPHVPITMQLVRASYGLRLYANLHVCYAACLPGCPDKTRVKITWENGDVESVIADRFEGGQRLLFPPETTESIVHALCKGESFSVAIGFCSAVITAENFGCEFPKMADGLWW